MRTSLGGVYRFGPFQVNAITGELLKNGNRIKLQEQPFRLLVVLLENAGEMVTRGNFATASGSKIPSSISIAVFGSQFAN